MLIKKNFQINSSVFLFAHFCLINAQRLRLDELDQDVRIMTTKPQHPEEIKRQGNELFTRRRYEDAIKLYGKALAHPNFRTVQSSSNMKGDDILLKQSIFLMRGRAYGNLDKLEHAKNDFNKCIEILDHTKYAYKARLVRAQLQINTMEHMRLSKLDCEAVINVKSLIVY